MPQVSPIARLNGGAAGAKASVTASSTVTATLDSITGVTGVEWWIASTDETSLPTDYTLVQSGIVGETATFTALGDGTAGILASRVNNGIDPSTGNLSSAMTATIKFYVPTNPGSLEVGCLNETFQSDATFGSTGEINEAIRGVGAGGSVTFATVKAALAAANTAVDFNNQKLTGVAAGTAGTDAANVSQVASANASLTARVSTEEVTRGSADTSLTTRISTEESTRSSGVTSLTTRVSTEESARASAATSLTTRVSTEESARASAATSLTTRISAAESTETSTTTSLTTRVSTEESVRGSAVTSLTTRVSGEESARASAVTSLDTRVSTEISTRASADTSLTTRISTEESTRGSAVTSLTTRVSIAENTRLSGDASIDTRLSTDESTLALVGGHNMVFAASTIALTGTDYLPPGYLNATAKTNPVTIRLAKGITIDLIKYVCRVPGSGAVTIAFNVLKGGVLQDRLQVNANASNGSVSVNIPIPEDGEVDLQVTRSGALDTAPTDPVITLGCRAS